LKKRTGTEVNQMVLAFPEELNLLCHHELGREIQDEDYNLRYRRIWDRLRMNSVSEGLPISNPPSIFLRIDANLIRQVNIQELDPETKPSETGIVIPKDSSVISLQSKSRSLSD
jgi:hypothetical protein